MIYLANNPCLFLIAKKRWELCYSNFVCNKEANESLPIVLKGWGEVTLISFVCHLR